jgi:hypothetical protein
LGSESISSNVTAPVASFNLESSSEESLSGIETLGSFSILMGTCLFLIIVLFYIR